jgi:glycogen debranching enzyme
VVDTPNGNDPALRPNQLLAISLPFPLLEGEKAEAVVNICARHLLGSFGLRSLAPTDERYIGRYTGDIKTRDGAYHQGTMWAWLIGPFVSAHFRVFGNARQAFDYLRPFEHHLRDNGLGSIAEVFDGDAPHGPHGCIAQAWSVAEVLRVYRELEPHL